MTQDVGDRAELLERAALAAHADAQYDLGLDMARQAVEGYRSQHDPLGAGRVSGLLGTLFVELSRQPEAIDVLNAAEAELPVDADELRAELAARRSRALMRSRQNDAAVAAADLALSIAEPRAMLEVVAEALVNKGAALGNGGRWREGAAILEVGARLAGEVGANILHLRALNNLANVLTDDDPVGGVRITTEALEVARRLGVRGMVSWLTGTVAMSRHWLGRDWDETIAMLGTAAEEAGNDSDRLRLLIVMHYFQAARGEVDDAAFELVLALDKSTDDVGMRGLVLLVTAERFMARGEPEQAYVQFKGSGEIDPTDVQAVIGKLRSSIWAGDGQLVREAAAELDGMPQGGRMVISAKRWGRASTAALDGRREEAIAGFRDAIARATAVETHFEAGRMALDAAILMPDDPDARTIAEGARSTFEALRAQVYIDRLDAALGGGNRVVAAPPAAIESSPSEAIAQPS